MPLGEGRTAIVLRSTGPARAQADDNRSAEEGMEATFRSLTAGPNTIFIFFVAGPKRRAPAICSSGQRAHYSRLHDAGKIHSTLSVGHPATKRGRRRWVQIHARCSKYQGRIAREAVRLGLDRKSAGPVRSKSDLQHWGLAR